MRASEDADEAGDVGQVEEEGNLEDDVMGKGLKREQNIRADKGVRA